LLTGGKNEGLYYEATVLAMSTYENLSSETFGPVASIIYCCDCGGAYHGNDSGIYGLSKLALLLLTVRGHGSGGASS
jgi:acyl-CoA reductase-like NAD-dependent aldehyde dehydrogenase